MQSKRFLTKNDWSVNIWSLTGGKRNVELHDKELFLVKQNHADYKNVITKVST